MKKLAAITLLSSLAFATAAQAQSAFVMVIPTSSIQRPQTAPAQLTTAERIEIAAKDACEKPFIRDLKGQTLYARCLEEARAEAAAQVAERTEFARLSRS